MTEKVFAPGHCLCDKVSYSITSEPMRMGQCHCDDCQRSTGTGHISNAFFPSDAVTITGQTSSYASIADNGSEITRHFCPECGSRLFSTNNVFTNITGFSIGCMDDHSWFKPQAIVYNKRKPLWDFMDNDVPSFNEMPPLPN